MTEYNSTERTFELIKGYKMLADQDQAVEASQELIERIVELEAILYDVHNDVTKNVKYEDVGKITAATYEKIVMALLPVPKVFIPHEDVKDMI